MVFRDPGGDTVAAERMENRDIFTLADDAEIKSMLIKLTAEGTGRAFDQTDADVRMDLPESNDPFGKDLVIDRIGGSDRYRPGLKAADAVRGLLELFLDVKQTADERKQLRTFLRRLHPAFCADQQRKTELLFHSGNAAADPGRCITQLFCCGGQTAGVNRTDQCFVFFGIHRITPYLPKPVQRDLFL